MTSYRTVTSSSSAASQVTSQQVTIPSGVQPGDTVFIAGMALPLSVTPAVLTASSTGTAPGAAVITVSGSESIASATLTVWKVTAGGGDANATVTITSSASAFMAAGVISYPGAGGIDVASAAFGGASTAAVTCPVLATGAGADWALCIAGGASEGGSPTAPAGLTSRLVDWQSSVATFLAFSDSAGPVGPMGTSIGGGQFTAPSSGNSLMLAVTIGLRQQFAPTLSATEGSGVQDWVIPSDINLPATLGSGAGLRVLVPASPAAGRRHNFVIALPVNSGWHDTANGNAIDVILAAGLHNALNITVLEPQWGVESWCADNPVNVAAQLESHVQLLAQWAVTSGLASGGETVGLIGFSKTGIGGQGLVFRQPGLFARCATWDAPLMATALNTVANTLTDATFGSGVSGDPDSNYGTDANFQANYRLSSAHLTGWIAGQNFTTVKRLWIGGGDFTFSTDVAAYQSLLTSLGIQYDGTWTTPAGSHAWLAPWVTAALASIIPATSGSGLLMSAGII